MSRSASEISHRRAAVSWLLPRIVVPCILAREGDESAMITYR